MFILCGLWKVFAHYCDVISRSMESQHHTEYCMSTIITSTYKHPHKIQAYLTRYSASYWLFFVSTWLNIRRVKSVPLSMRYKLTCWSLSRFPSMGTLYGLSLNCVASKSHATWLWMKFYWLFLLNLDSFCSGMYSSLCCCWVVWHPGLRACGFCQCSIVLLEQSISQGGQNGCHTMETY